MQAESPPRDTCPACSSEHIDRSIDEVDGICGSCGFVVGQEHDTVSLDWEIANGEFQRPEEDEWISECRIRNATEKQLMQAIEILEAISDELRLSDQIRHEAVDVYCDAFRGQVTDGRVTACVVAVALCVASRRIGQPIPTSRLIQFENVDEKKYNSSHLTLCDALEVDLQTPSARDYVPYLCQQLELTDDNQESVTTLLDAVADRQSFVGKDPAGIAAAGVYLLEQEHTQQEVAEAVGLSTETIRLRVQDLREVSDHV